MFMKHALNSFCFCNIGLIELFFPVRESPFMVAIASGYGDVCTVIPLAFSACSAFLFISSNYLTRLFCSLFVTVRGVKVCNFEFFLRFFRDSFPRV